MVSKIVVKYCTHLFEDEVLAAWTKDREWKGHLVHGPTSYTRLCAEKSPRKPAPDFTYTITRNVPTLPRSPRPAPRSDIQICSRPRNPHLRLADLRLNPRTRYLHPALKTPDHFFNTISSFLQHSRQPLKSAYVINRATCKQRCVWGELGGRGGGNERTAGSGCGGAGEGDSVRHSASDC